ncbi:mitochondrial fission factor homolog A isoform X2 [Pangasianodon hypophthalmus]|uniref:mitochondrial fission factor homolog A isoform X2 n=1 Tax=Pangasianodon hypophthalmus TaxID=310915 RepID=UPI000EFDC447|nr:mitochondrial fission factor homolog A isoform X2 [Pangasianodon hypophthalmus]
MSEGDFAIMADMAEVSRIQYELDYTEGISQQMRIPDRLKVGPGSSMVQPPLFPEEPHSTLMQVPDRIVVAGHEVDPHFSRPRELDLIQSIPVESVELKTPPRVLTLQDQALDFLEPVQQPGPAQLKEEIRSHTRSRRERCVSETLGACHNGQIVKYDATALVTLDAGLEGAPDDLALADAPALRRQIVKLNRRLQVLEHENKERVRREMVMYSLTVAFWLVNTWMWVRR